MGKLFVTDTILRDAHQSLAATRMTTKEMLPACEMLDAIGYWSLEVWGGATFDSCLRYLNEDPWERLRTLRKALPNTRLQSNDIHVSDPDGYLSDSAEMNINTALCAIRQQADVFVVTLRSIGDAEPKRFATQLFNDWGIGDAQTNNGVLLLFVEDQHALEFETGYGAEATLTDARCERIFRNTIVPYFRRCLPP